MRKSTSLVLPLVVLAVLTYLSLNDAGGSGFLLQAGPLPAAGNPIASDLVQPEPTPNPVHFVLPDNPKAFDNFGSALAQDGDLLAAGAPNTDLEGARNAGAVYVFRKVGDTWQQIARLTPELPQPDGRFGSALALEGETLAIGAPYEYNPDAGNASGAVYLFKVDQNGWAQTARLSAPGGGPFDLFGSALGLNGADLAIGARAADGPKGERDAGAAYIYHQAGSDWTLQARLGTDAAPFDHFGHALAFTGDELLIGAPDADVAQAPNAGQVYVYRHNRGNWTEHSRLTTREVRPQARFGLALAVQGGMLAVLAPQEYQKESTMPPNAFSYEMDFGVAHIFERRWDGWRWQARLFPKAAIPEDAIRINSVEITNSGDRARLALSGYGRAGVLFVFEGQDGAWEALPHVDVPNASLIDGRGLAAVGDVYLMGDPFYDIQRPGGDLIQSTGAIWIIKAPESQR